MSVQLAKWPSKVKLTRGDNKVTEYSPAGEAGETVEVPQIDESLDGSTFFQALINLVGSEDETKKIVNKNVLALPAIHEGRQKFKQSYKKSGVLDLHEATKNALVAMREYVPVLAKERGAVVSEAFAKANKMDALKAARAKVESGEMTWEDYQAMLDEAFALD